MNNLSKRYNCHRFASLMAYSEKKEKRNNKFLKSPHLAGWQDDAGNATEEPAASEAGDGGEGRRGEAHHHVRHRHVTHQQVHTRVQGGGPGTKNNYRFGKKNKEYHIVVEYYIQLRE